MKKNLPQTHTDNKRLLAPRHCAARNCHRFAIGEKIGMKVLLQRVDALQSFEPLNAGQPLALKALS